MIPTADQIAMAIVTASRLTGADPIRVLDGQRDVVGATMAYETTRARAYAAFALHGMFPIVSMGNISRYVGASSPEAYLSVLKNRQRRKELYWITDDGLETVVAAVLAVGEAPASEARAEVAAEPKTPPEPPTACLAHVEMEPEGPAEAEMASIAFQPDPEPPLPPREAVVPAIKQRPMPGRLNNGVQMTRAQRPVSRPAATPGKRNLLDELRQAVENTQAMTPPPED